LELITLDDGLALDRTMKLSDYVADFLAKIGVRHVFAITGGASLHLIDSIGRHPDIEYICNHHEQAGAMAADAYARVTGNIGAALATSGPGGTNMITGICCAYYDSIPVLYITGQVSSVRFKGETGVRQMGFQETDIVEMCTSVTKYAVTVKDPKNIRFELEKALWIAREGRPGPVLVDIPDNFQREQIEPETLEPFIPPVIVGTSGVTEAAAQMLEWLSQAKRPIMVFGSGIRTAGAVSLALEFAERFGLPINPTWGTVDCLPNTHALLVGTFGTHGSRVGNFAIQNADLVISIGSRLDTHMIGSPFSTFARGARKVVVDVDPTEVAKFPHYGLPIDLPVVADAKVFLQAALALCEKTPAPAFEPWLERISEWKVRYPQVRPEYYQTNALNPYVFVKGLSDASDEGEVIVVDTGCGVAWMSQAFEFKAAQRYFHAFNNTPMGYALPAAIAASLALDNRRVICVSGDGGLMMNIQEISTIVHLQLPVKLFILDNRGYSMIQQTQDQWLEGRYAASDAESMHFPDFAALLKVWGIDTVEQIDANSAIESTIHKILSVPGPAVCVVHLRPEERVIPQVKFGRPIEDSEPLLDRVEFLSSMIVDPLPVSRD
jgi:acetolactate synthase I/II/III large subunit